MKTIIASDWRLLSRVVCTLLLGIAALWAMPGNACAQVLYVSPQAANVVGEYDATSGAAINANLVTAGEGLNRPVGLALSGNNLFVSNFGGTTVGEYDATTGAAINASFITGLNAPYGMALSGNNLFVANGSDFGTTVGEYNATTGAAITPTSSRG